MYSLREDYGTPFHYRTRLSRRKSQSKIRFLKIRSTIFFEIRSTKIRSTTNSSFQVLTQPLDSHSIKLFCHALHKSVVVQSCFVFYKAIIREVLMFEYLAMVFSETNSGLWFSICRQAHQEARGTLHFQLLWKTACPWLYDPKKRSILFPS